MKVDRIKGVALLFKSWVGSTRSARLEARPAQALEPFTEGVSGFRVLTLREVSRPYRPLPGPDIPGEGDAALPEP